MKRTHGLSSTRTYKCWHGIRQRMNPFWKRYDDYGGRGIKVCSFINESLSNFVNLMGACPEGFSLDRINNDGHYSCGSCDQCKQNGWPMNLRWANAKQQCRNRRNNVHLVVNGRKMTVAELAERVGISTESMHKRVRTGKRGNDLLRPRNDSIARRIK